MQTGYLWQMLLAVATIYSCLSPVACVYEETIQVFLEEFRMRMCHPIPNLGLPALDPLELGPAETAVNNKYLVDFTGSIEDFKLNGLSDFIVNTLKINVIPGVTRSTINVTFPHTYLKSLYTAKGSLAYILNLSGDGNAEASIEDFSFEISWRIKASTSLAITGLQIEMRMGDLKINFENLLEEKRINDFVHALVNEMGVELLGDIWDYEQNTVVDKVETLINSKIPDLLKIITGGEGGGSESSPIFDGVEPDCKLDGRK
ncbi:uncharacterized protein LOC115766255 [Drosophila novamexicana]|uniref:uncharacterized protein LOC115766197 n=1 Tax=Drosophila novamexicana TaxID=47314 RepID=UPI0011E5BEAB|nr:uncharacterized protein LOC115766197 [Drosophila novamexicana]XP_030565975.1 uncharacterized protein LOC115766255 [Drosophila novamexicana]